MSYYVYFLPAGNGSNAFITHLQNQDQGLAIALLLLYTANFGGKKDPTLVFQLKTKYTGLNMVSGMYTKSVEGQISKITR